MGAALAELSEALANAGPRLARALGAHVTLNAGRDKPAEAIKAFVVLRAGAQVTAGDILAHCAKRLATYMVPKEIAFIDLPIGSQLIHNLGQSIGHLTGSLFMRNAQSGSNVLNNIISQGGT